MPENINIKTDILYMIRKIRYCLITPGCNPVVNENGNAFDLRVAKGAKLNAPTVQEDGTVKFDTVMLPLGIAMELPKGCKADVKPRSSMFKKWKVLQTNSIGLIDNSYCGDTDEWKLPLIAMEKTHINKGDRLCQFEIRPAQTATLWEKFLWLITTSYQFVEVESLGNKARGGFGEGTKDADKK